MECNIECVSWVIYWHDCKLTLFNLMSHVIVHIKIINKANAVIINKANYRCLGQRLKVCILFGYNPQIIFVTVCTK